MDVFALGRRARLFALLAGLILSACATQREGEELEPPVIDEVPASAAPQSVLEQPATAQPETSKEPEAEVPLAVAEAEPPVGEPPQEIVVRGELGPQEIIQNRVAEGQRLLRNVDLQYYFDGSGKNRVLRGRPVAFALWSETQQQWSIAQIELPRPPVKWKPGGKPLRFRNLTPGIVATHVKGTGAERLMFSFTKNGEPLKVYGRKFPVFDNALLKRKQWSALVETAKPIVYLPYTDDTFEPALVRAGRDFLLSTAHTAMDQLRRAEAPSVAFPGKLLADVIPVQVVTTLAVIEQTDDQDYIDEQARAFDEVLNQYGLKQGEAYRYSVSSANALGPMQFTNRRNNGTYAMVVRRCQAANLDPDFALGATNLLNAMKAAICLLDLDLADMREDIRTAWLANPDVLGIFPVAAYNGGARNVTKLYKVLNKIDVGLDQLARADAASADPAVTCPCVWKTDGSGVRPVALPRYNNENRWYIEKYQSIVKLFE
ncbi:MAG: hypothetical protein QM718_14065 [Steroidobacteraceae bacterium]